MNAEHNEENLQNEIQRLRMGLLVTQITVIIVAIAVIFQ